LRVSETTSPLGVIKPKAMKDDKGREGGHKIGKMGRHCLWTAPNTNSNMKYDKMTLLSKCRKTPLSSDLIEDSKNLEFNTLLWSNPRETFYLQDNKGEDLYSIHINLY
jgi:hypothetical protein